MWFAAEAYRVTCEASTSPPNVIERRIVTVLIDRAPVRSLQVFLGLTSA